MLDDNSTLVNGLFRYLSWDPQPHIYTKKKKNNKNMEQIVGISFTAQILCSQSENMLAQLEYFCILPFYPVIFGN